MKKARELLTCELCGKNDLRGSVGKVIHDLRAHKDRNWSTRRKAAQ